MTDAEASSCPLCGSTLHAHFHSDRRRDYRRCQTCHLVFVPPPYHLTAAREKAEYDLHHNDPHDPGYRAFLGRLCEPLTACLTSNSRGLDFGCGPGPALALMLRQAGHDVSVYDPFYAADERVFADRYHFITATEVVEHLARPGAELERLWRCLLPGGWLGVMTKLVRDREAFANWHYKNDPTHIGFYSRQTFTWLARQWQTDMRFIGDDVMLVQKPH
ncbi:class I SAM-dependent methyltransferase [Exilibacterium tricleocarpae]|uniref:Class I SAM-dependent methyltransferase n=1 Tax=Exilibacterium tricleocarpae TaxID=2591008 RepID=A0A545T883_9GAMM|nr:class I SAM-dependent methyltransferase [Exilibacterium tricleocarpae]TQV73433.1 class I SAM-dependent methyltransferase [Exilibacterium tricleocarpae]